MSNAVQDAQQEPVLHQLSNRILGLQEHIGTLITRVDDTANRVHGDEPPVLETALGGGAASVPSNAGAGQLGDLERSIITLGNDVNRLERRIGRLVSGL